MAGIKIVDLPALGRDLLSTDLLEMSIGGTASRKITGQEIMNASKLNVGSTPIVSGTVGRVLFQGTGNVLQQSANLFWDSTNNRLGIGTSTPARTLEVNGETMLRDAVTLSNAGDRGRVTWGGGYFSFQALGSEGLSFMLPSNARVISIPNATGNVLINTTTDAGFRLDVNGTARVVGNLNLGNSTDVSILFNPANSLSISGGKLNISTNTSVSGRFGIGGSSVSGDSTFIITLATNLTGALGRAAAIENTIFANANNAVLIGLDINSTFSNGAFTGVTNVDLRTKNAGVVIGSGYGYGALYGYSNDGIVQVVDGGTSSLSGASYATQIWLRPSGAPASYNSNYWATLEQSTGGLFLQSGRYNSNIVIKTGRTGTSGNIYFNNAGGTMSMFFGATSNFAIGTTTDAGFRLDVNGTARVSGNLTFGFNTTYITTSSTGGGINAGINTFFNNGAIWIDDTSVRALDITYNNGIKIANTTRYPLSLGTSSKAVASAQLEMVSTTQGFLPPRMTNAQRTAIVSPAVGLIVYCTDVTEGLWVYKSTGWTFIV